MNQRYKRIKNKFNEVDYTVCSSNDIVKSKKSKKNIFVKYMTDRYQSRISEELL